MSHHNKISHLEPHFGLHAFQQFLLPSLGLLIISLDYLQPLIFRSGVNQDEKSHDFTQTLSQASGLWYLRKIETITLGISETTGCSSTRFLFGADTP